MKPSLYLYLIIGALTALCATARGAEVKTAKVKPLDSSFENNSYHFIGERFAAQMREMEWGDGVVAVMIQDAELPLNAFASNEAQPMEPAGALKIVTAAAALERLGPDFHFNTTLGISGQVVKHELKGGIVVTGDGDPTLSARLSKSPDEIWPLFDRWAKLLRKQGIKKVTGLTIGDDRAFDGEWQSPGCPLERLGSPDLPSVAALNFNHNCIDIFWQYSKKTGVDAQYKFFPDLPKHVFFANKVKVEAQAQRERQYVRDRDSNVIQIAGAVPVRSEIHERAAIENPAAFFAAALKSRLEYRGLVMPGGVSSGNKLSPPEIPSNLKILDSHPSPALRQILGEMMHYDLALNADVVFKAMGRQASGKPGSFENGQEAVREFIDTLHLPGGIWTFSDGSGLSKVSRISPSQLLSLMRQMRRRPQGPAFEALFPRAWEPGEMAQRFRPYEETSLAKNAKPVKKKKPLDPKNAPPIWAKNGSAPGVETLVGYVNTKFGRKLSFAIMINGSRESPGLLRDQIDQLVLGLTE